MNDQKMDSNYYEEKSITCQGDRTTLRESFELEHFFFGTCFWNMIKYIILKSKKRKTLRRDSVKKKKK